MQHGPRDRNALALPAGQRRPALSNQGVIAVRKALDEVVDSHRLRRRDGLTATCVRQAIGDVLPDGTGEHERFLQHQCDLPAHKAQRQLTQIMAIQQDLAA